MTEDSPNKRHYYMGFFLCYYATLRRNKGERLSNDEARKLVDEFCKTNGLALATKEEFDEILMFNMALMQTDLDQYTRVLK